MGDVMKESFVFKSNDNQSLITSMAFTVIPIKQDRIEIEAKYNLKKSGVVPIPLIHTFDKIMLYVGCSINIPYCPIFI